MACETRRRARPIADRRGGGRAIAMKMRSGLVGPLGRWPALGAFLLLLLFQAGPPVLAAAPPAGSAAAADRLTGSPEPRGPSRGPELEGGLPDWLQLKAGTLAHWDYATDPSDPTRYLISAKDPAARSGDEKRVLAIFFKTSSAHYDAMSTILDVFYARKTHAVFTALNVKGDEQRGREALAYARAQKFDLIFAMGSEATDIVHRNFRNGPIPVVTMVAKDPVLLGQVNDYDSGSGTNIAYTSVSMPIDVQIAYLKQLRADLKNIAVLYEDSNKSAKEAQVKPLKDVAAADGIRVLEVVVQDTKQAVPELTAKVPQAVEEMKRTDPDEQSSIFWVTGSTSVFDNLNVVAKYADNIPVIDSAPDHVREGENSAVLAFGVSFANSAYQGAVYGLDILSGKTKAGELKVGVVTPPDIAINFYYARKIGLKIPFGFFESASYIYDANSKLVRKDGLAVRGAQ
jgi:putative ABC transport system substrate-binding protein